METWQEYRNRIMVEMISIILPCYNPIKEYFNVCIDSIKKQTYTNYELVLINDGSEESYSEYIKEIAESDHRIRLIEQKNAGVSESRNRGVKAAKGEYVLFVDADDILLENYLDEAADLIDKTGADLIQGATFFLREEIMKEERLFCYEIADDCQIKDLIIQMLDVSKPQYNNIGKNKGKIARGPWCKLVRKQIAEKVPFKKDLYLGEDRVWNLELVTKCKAICLAYRNWYIYRNNDCSVSHRYDSNRLNGYKDYILKIKNLIPKENDIQKHYYMLTFEVFCEVLDCHFFHEDYPKKKEVHHHIVNTLNCEPWCAIHRISYTDLSYKRKMMMFLVKHHLFFLYHLIRKVYITNIRRKEGRINGRRKS